MLGYLSDKYFKNMVCAVIILNYPVALEDIINCHVIFITNVPSLNRKLVRQQPKPMVSNYVNISKEILQLHHTVSIVADLMFVYRVIFLDSISRYIIFTILQYIGKQTIGNLSISLENIN